MKHRRRLSGIAVLGVLFIVAAACKGGGGGGGGGAFGSVTIGPDEPIKIGTIMTVSGDTAFLGEDTLNGVKLAIDYLDGSFDGTDGQILGHDIQLVNQDETDPATNVCGKGGGRTGAQKLAADPKIVAVIGTNCSSAALGVADKILSAKGVPLISPSNTNPNLTAEGTHEDFYLRTAHNDKIQGAVVADWLTSDDGPCGSPCTAMATVHDESPYADALAAVARQIFEANGGQIVGDEAIQSTDKQFSDLLTTLAGGEPDVIYTPNFNPACGLFKKQMGENADLKDVPWVGSDGCLETAFIDTAGDAFTEPTPSFASGPDLSAIQEGEFYSHDFLPAYKELTGGAPTASFHAHAYDAMNILAQAIESSADQADDGSLTIDREGLKDALLATQGYDGLSGVITCTQLGDCATDVKIGVFEAPGWPVEGGKGTDQVFTETLTLEEAEAKAG